MHPPCGRVAMVTATVTWWTSACHGAWDRARSGSDPLPSAHRPCVQKARHTRGTSFADNTWHTHGCLSLLQHNSLPWNDIAVANCFPLRTTGASNSVRRLSRLCGSSLTLAAPDVLATSIGFALNVACQVAVHHRSEISIKGAARPMPRQKSPGSGRDTHQTLEVSPPLSHPTVVASSVAHSARSSSTAVTKRTTEASEKMCWSSVARRSIRFT